MKKIFISLSLMVMAALCACHDSASASRSTTPQPLPPPSERSEPREEGRNRISTSDRSEPEGQVPLARTVVDDRTFGQLVTTLSEDTGDFPSDNFVSNETSYLDIAKTFLHESRQEQVYIGVGPEQNLTYISLMQPRMAFIVDIRRDNMLEHMVLRAMIEKADTRVAFVERLTSRNPPQLSPEKVLSLSLEDILTRVAVTRPQTKLVDRSVEDTVVMMKRLGMTPSEDDRGSIRKVLQAFANKGVDIAYTMEKSKRRYPKLRELLTATDPEGTQRSFLSTEASYTSLRSLLLANRVVPVVGDFCGDHALKGIAEVVRDHDLKLGVFYTSNVEQYLFKAKCYDQFITNVKTFPITDDSVFIRVWFDQGRSHPKQRPGHRTTSVVMPMGTFMSRYEEGAYRNYWRVVIDEP